MDSKDFEFLYRKEFIILCLLLLSISFAQIASEQQLKIGTRTSGIDPVFILRNTVFEALGIFLPVITAIYLFFQKKSEVKRERRFAFGKYLFILTAFFIIMLAIAVPSMSENIIPENNTITTGTNTVPNTNPNTIIDPPAVTLPNSDYPSLNSQFLENFLNIVSNAFIFLILFLPLILIFLIRYRSKAETENITDTIEDEQSEIEKTHLARSILECYYQASNRLEERGADDSPAFTPIEFLKDVIDKKLIQTQDIDELTQLFEEAKFSDNEMTNEQVTIAKKIARSIIFAQKEIIRDSTTETGQKPKEDNQ